MDGAALSLGTGCFIVSITKESQQCKLSFIFIPRYDKNDKLWTMKHARKRDFLATSRASESSLLRGSHLWVVHNDSVKCSSEQENSYMINLTLHACQPEQFACDNAFCIAMEKRCDAKEDCLD